MKNIFKKVVFMFMICLAIGSISISVSAKSKTNYIKVPTGYTDSKTVTFKLSNMKKNAKIILKTFVDPIIYRKDKKAVRSRVYITMYDKNGKRIWGGEKTVQPGGIDLNLGRDHDVYKICVREVKLSWNSYWRVIYHFERPEYFTLTCKQNCYIK